MLAKPIALHICSRQCFEPSDIVGTDPVYMEAFSRMDNLFSAFFAVVIHLITFFLYLLLIL